MEQRQDPKCDNHVVRQSDNHPRRQSPLKAETDVHQDGDQRRHQRHRTGLRQISPHARTHEFNSLHRGVLVGGFVNHTQHFAAQHLTAVCTFSWRHTYHNVVAAAEVLQKRINEARFLQRIAHHVHIGRFFQRDFNNRTTGEIETPVKPAYAHHHDGRNQQET